MGVFIGTLTVIVFGYLIANVFNPKLVILEKIALGYLLGTGFFTYALFIGNVMGIEYNFINAFGILLLLIIIMLFTNILFKKDPRIRIKLSYRYVRKKWIQSSNLNKFIVVVLAVELFLSLLVNFYWPVADWDSLALYDFRAKALLERGFFDHSIISDYDLGYPLLTTLSHLWIYLLGGRNPMFVYSLFYLSLLICFYSTLVTAGVNNKLAMVFTLILASTSVIFEHSTWAYTNLPYATYLFLGIAYSYLWLKNQNDGLLLLSAVFVGFSYWTRTTEPFWVGMILLVILASIYKKKFWSIIYYPVIIIVVKHVWTRFVIDKIGHDTSFVELSIPVLIQKMIEVVRTGGIFFVAQYLWVNIFTKYLYLFIVFIITLYYNLFSLKRKKVMDFYLPLSVIVMLILILAGTVVLSCYYEGWELIGDSAYRMSMFLVPLLLFSSALTCGNILKDMKDR